MADEIRTAERPDTAGPFAIEERVGFDPIWNAIKRWDISRSGAGTYHAPTGDDVRAILAAIDAAGLRIVSRG